MSTSLNFHFKHFPLKFALQPVEILFQHYFMLSFKFCPNFHFHLLNDFLDAPLLWSVGWMVTQSHVQLFTLMVEVVEHEHVCRTSYPFCNGLSILQENQ